MYTRVCGRCIAQKKPCRLPSSRRPARHRCRARPAGKLSTRPLWMPCSASAKLPRPQQLMAVSRLVGILGQRLGRLQSILEADSHLSFFISSHQLSISAEQRKLQEQRRRLFQRQLERGGIIDAYSKPADHDVVHIADDNDDAAAAAAVNSGGVPLAPTMAEVLTPVPINTSGSGQAGGKRDRPKKQLAFPADTPAVDASADTGRGHGSSGRGGRGRSRKSSSSSRSGSRASAVVEA